MANVSYPIYGKVKTIVLPIPAGVLTLDQYKENYGIDLKEFIGLEANGAITMSFPRNTQVLLDAEDIAGVNTFMPAIKGSLLSISASISTSYSAGATDANITIGAYNYDDSGIIGLQIECDKDVSFELDNLKISGFIF